MTQAARRDGNDANATRVLPDWESGSLRRQKRLDLVTWASSFRGWELPPCHGPTRAGCLRGRNDTADTQEWTCTTLFRAMRKTLAGRKPLVLKIRCGTRRCADFVLLINYYKDRGKVPGLLVCADAYVPCGIRPYPIVTGHRTCSSWRPRHSSIPARFANHQRNYLLLSVYSGGM